MLLTLESLHFKSTSEGASSPRTAIFTLRICNLSYWPRPSPPISSHRSGLRKLLRMTTNLPAWLEVANHDFAKRFPGETGERQPVHAVYGGAHLFKFDTCQKFGV